MLTLQINDTETKMYNLQEIRKEFPILQREVYGKPLIYLDNAATTQKPLCVIEAITEAYTNVNANVHRGVHFLSQSSTKRHVRPYATSSMPVTATK